MVSTVAQILRGSGFIVSLLQPVPTTGLYYEKLLSEFEQSQPDQNKNRRIGALAKLTVDNNDLSIDIMVHGQKEQQSDTAIVLTSFNLARVGLNW